MTANKRSATTQESVGSPALSVLRRRWWVVGLTVVFALIVAFAGLSLVKPTYKATVTLQVPIATGSQAPSDLTYVDSLMNTYTQLAQQPTVRAAVARALHGQPPTLQVSAQPNTELLNVSALSHSPSVAQRAANIAASALISRANSLSGTTSQQGQQSLSAQIDQLSNSITQLRLKLTQLPVTATPSGQRLALQQQISGQEANYQALVNQRAQLQVADATRYQSLSLVQPASVPTSPVSPRKVPLMALALALGLLGGLGLAFAFERFLPRLYTVAAIETAADAEVLATIPRVTGKVAAKPLYNGGSPAQEAFGVLAVHVLAEARDRTVQTILVTSRSQGDGKSTVASNLAAELARSGRRVLLVDADMRSPSVRAIFDLDSGVGLSDLLEHAELHPVIDELTVRPEGIPNLSVISSGGPPEGPARLLASERLGLLITRLNESYDFVVFDAPPLVVSDPLSIAAHADLVLLVVGGGGVPDRDIQAATRQLSGIGSAHVAVVINRWRGHEATYNYAYPGAR